MQIQERKIGDVNVIELQLAPHVRHDYSAFQQLVRAYLARGEQRLIVNLAGCDWIDSAGLGELINALVHTMRQGGSLKLAAVPPKVKAILAVTNLAQVFDIYENEQAALASFVR